MGKKGPSSSSSSSGGGGKKGDASNSNSKGAPAPAVEEGGPKKRPPKGHRQKGAGAVIADKGPIERGGVVVQSWQRVPSTLLQEHCQREKRPRPNYREVSLKPGEKGVKMQVVLPDPKGQADRALRFLPTVASPDSTVAKENAALLALLHLMPSLPLERKLPEPYRTTWLQSASAAAAAAKGGGPAAAAGAAGTSKKPAPTAAASKPQPTPTATTPTAATTTASTTTSSLSSSLSTDSEKPKQPQAVVLASALAFPSLKEKKAVQEQKRQSRLAKERDRERRRKLREDYRLLMSTKMRRVVEGALGIVVPSVLDEEGEEDDTASSSDSEGDDDEEAAARRNDREEARRMDDLVASLTRMGFSERQGRHAVRAVERSCGGNHVGVEEALDYLLLHLPEEQLPARFDPRGRNFDVVLPSATDSSSKASSPSSLWGNQYGLAPQDCTALSALSDDAARLRALRAGIVMGGEGASIKGSEGGGEGWEEELEALRVIYCEEEGAVALESLTSAFSAEGEGDAWRPTHLLTLKGGLPPGHALRVWLCESYPAVPAFALVEGPRATSAIQRALAATAAGNAGHPALYELLLAATEGLEGGGNDEEAVYFVSSPPPPSTPTTPAPTEPPTPTPSTTGHKHPHKPPSSSSAAYAPSGFWSPKPIPASDAQLQSALLTRGQTPEGKRMLDARSRLPAARAKGEFLGMVGAHRVVLVAGETGCGKTTQIPQFILEDAEARGEGSRVKVVVAQPRRIAAIGVAQRVAEERGEAVGGSASSVGYMIRGENKTGPNTRLAFCTTGIILRRLQQQRQGQQHQGNRGGGGGGALAGNITHLIVDEVHERNLDADFLLLLARRLMLEKQDGPPLRLILMSATMDAAKVARYFQACNLPVGVVSAGGKQQQAPKPALPPVLSIPGFTHPVEDVWLESLPALLGPSRTPKWLQKLADAGPGDTRDREAQLDYRLLRDLVLYVASPDFASRYPGPSQGSVLVFLPGVGEISRLCSLLSSSHTSNTTTSRHRRRRTDDDDDDDEEGEGDSELERAKAALWVLPLHGALSGADQSLVFRTGLPGGKSKKIVVSTNVAETSITIPDVTVVIDAGRVKENGYDPLTRMAALVEGWASQDSIRQRRGRAGRVRPGMALHLLSSWTHSFLPAHSTPEVQRAPLEQVVLQAMACFGSSSHTAAEHPRAFFQGMLDPPEDARVEAAVRTLLEVQAVVEDDSPTPKQQQQQQLRVTPLGHHLAALPCPVRLGKMLVYGAVLGVLGPTLSIAAGMLVRSPLLSLQSHPDAEAIAAAREKHLGGARLRKSDHLLFALLMEKFTSLPGSMSARRKFCREIGVVFERVQEMQTLSQQFSRDLAALGFTRDACNDAADALLAAVDERSQRAYWRLVKAAVCVGLYPNVIKLVRPPPKYAKVAGGALAVDHSARELKFFVRTHGGGSGGSGDTAGPPGNSNAPPPPGGRVPDERVFIHPSSVNFTQGVFTVPWLVYSEVVRTSKAFVRDCSEVSPYALLLAARALKQAHTSSGSGHGSDEHVGTLLLDQDGYVRFAAVGRIGALVAALKRRVDALLEAKVQDPSVDIATAPETQALVKLIATEGMG